MDLKQLFATGIFALASSVSSAQSLEEVLNNPISAFEAFTQEKSSVSHIHHKTPKEIEAESVEGATAYFSKEDRSIHIPLLSENAQIDERKLHAQTIMHELGHSKYIATLPELKSLYEEFDVNTIKDRIALLGTLSSTNTLDSIERNSIMELVKTETIINEMYAIMFANQWVVEQARNGMTIDNIFPAYLKASEDPLSKFILPSTNLTINYLGSEAAGFILTENFEGNIKNAVKFIEESDPDIVAKKIYELTKDKSEKEIDIIIKKGVLDSVSGLGDTFNTDFFTKHWNDSQYKFSETLYKLSTYAQGRNNIASVLTKDSDQQKLILQYIGDLLDTAKKTNDARKKNISFAEIAEEYYANYGNLNILKDAYFFNRDISVTEQSKKRASKSLDLLIELLHKEDAILSLPSNTYGKDICKLLEIRNDENDTSRTLNALFNSTKTLYDVMTYSDIKEEFEKNRGTYENIEEFGISNPDKIKTIRMRNYALSHEFHAAKMIQAYFSEDRAKNVIAYNNFLRGLLSESNLNEEERRTIKSNYKEALAFYKQIPESKKDAELLQDIDVNEVVIRSIQPTRYILLNLSNE